MNIATQLIAEFPKDISHATVTRSDLHGEDAINVKVSLVDGRTVEGTFAKHPRAGFGGVQFSGPKDVVGLMTAKIKSVLEGNYERSQRGEPR